MCRGKWHVCVCATNVCVSNNVMMAKPAVAAGHPQPVSTNVHACPLDMCPHCVQQREKVQCVCNVTCVCVNVWQSNCEKGGGRCVRTTVQRMMNLKNVQRNDPEWSCRCSIEQRQKNIDDIKWWRLWEGPVQREESVSKSAVHVEQNRCKERVGGVHVYVCANVVLRKPWCVRMCVVCVQ